MIKILLIILLSSAFMQINSSSLNKFGLKTSKGEVLELLDLATRAIVHSNYAEIQYTYTYKNALNNSVEAQFDFTPSKTFIFNKFEAILNNQTKITEKIFEKKTAREMCGRDPQKVIYVPYFQISKFASKSLRFNIGKIPPNETVEIIFSAIQSLELIFDKFYELQLPAVLDEKFSSPLKNDWKIQVEVKSNSPFAILDGPTHILTSKVDANSSSKVFKVSWNVSVNPHKDFICTIYFGSEKLEKFEAVMGTHPKDPNDHVLLVNFLPASDAETTQNLLENGNYDLMREPSFEIECFDSEGQKVQSERPFQDLFWKDETVAKWAFLKNITQIKSCYAEFSYYNGREDKKIREEIAIHEIRQVTDIWHKVVSTDVIRRRQNELFPGSILVPESAVEEIVNLSTKYQVFSGFTCFLGTITDALAREDSRAGDYLCTKNAQIDEKSETIDACAWCGVDINFEIDDSSDDSDWDSVVFDEYDDLSDDDFESEIERAEYEGVVDLDELEAIDMNREEDSKLLQSPECF